MKRSCQHCGELIVGDAYRVTSEEDNVSLIWLFALSVLWRRKRLGLRVEEISISSKTLSVRSTSNATPPGIHK